MTKAILLLFLLFASFKSFGACNQQCATNKIIKAGWLKKAQKENINVFMYPKLVFRGSKVEVGPFKNAAPQKILNHSWLFYADHEPGARFEHRTTFILVDQTFGGVRVRQIGIQMEMALKISMNYLVELTQKILIQMVMGSMMDKSTRAVLP